MFPSQPIASHRVPSRPIASQPVPARPSSSQPVPARPNPLLGPPALPSAPLPHLSFLDVFHSSRPTITRFTRINIHQSSLHIAQGVCVDSCRLQFRTKEAEEFPSGRRRRSGVWSTDSWWFPHSLRSVLHHCIEYRIGAWPETTPTTRMITRRRR